MNTATSLSEKSCDALYVQGHRDYDTAKVLYFLPDCS